VKKPGMLECSQITTPRGDGLFLLVLEGTLIKVPKVTKV
jgi:hypothetical protein